MPSWPTTLHGSTRSTNCLMCRLICGMNTLVWSSFHSSLIISVLFAFSPYFSFVVFWLIWRFSARWAIHIYNLGLILARGRIDPAPEDRYNAESERYFDQFRNSRSAVPDSYSAVDAGFTFFSAYLFFGLMLLRHRHFCVIMLGKLGQNCSSMLLNFGDYRKAKTKMRVYMGSTKCSW